MPHVSPDPAPFLVTGPAGTGRTHLLEQWAEAVRRSTGATPHHTDARRLHATDDPARVIDPLLEAVVAGQPITVDDAQQLPGDVIEQLTDQLTAEPPSTVAVSITGWPTSAALDHLTDVIARIGTITNSAHLDDAAAMAHVRERSRTAQRAGLDDAACAAVVRACGGSVALLSDAVDHGWDGDLTVLPDGLRDAVRRRVRRVTADVGDALTDVIDCTSLGAPVDLAIAAARQASGVPDAVHPATHASGLVRDGSVIALVTAALVNDSTEDRRRKGARLLLDLPDQLDPTLRARLRRAAGTDTGAESMLTTAVAAFRLGDDDAAEIAARLADVAPPATIDADTGADLPLLLLGHDARMWRWPHAARHRSATSAGQDVTALASACVGDIDALDREPGQTRSIWADCHHAITRFAHGDTSTAIGIASQASDDARLRRLDDPAGITPAALGALICIAAGDPLQAVDLTNVALRHDVGGPGEQQFHRLLSAHAHMQLGDFTPALDLVRAGDDERHGHRDRLALAALDAALARRSGDTARLRAGWAKAAPLLARDTVSWLSADLLTELLCAGERVGDASRIADPTRRLTTQLRGLPASGPGPTTAAWIDLQLAVAGSRLATFRAPSDLAGIDTRSSARHAALPAWLAVGRGAADREQIQVAADLLASNHDDWEASRLLGQAALDQADPTASRALLEAARLLVTAPSESSDPLTDAGLSAREAEVARLVVDGFTYRDIGAQLYISPKTVEHHVAKIRLRLGASTRAEMIATIRPLVATS